MYPSQVFNYGLPVHSEAIQGPTFSSAHPSVYQSSLRAALIVCYLKTSISLGKQRIVKTHNTSASPQPRPWIHTLEAQWIWRPHLCWPWQRPSPAKGFLRSSQMHFNCYSSLAWVRPGLSQNLPLENGLLTLDIAKLFFPLNFFKRRKVKLPAWKHSKLNFCPVQGKFL